MELRLYENNSENFISKTINVDDMKIGESMTLFGSLNKIYNSNYVSEYNIITKITFYCIVDINVTYDINDKLIEDVKYYYI